MSWIKDIDKTIQYIEEHMTDDLRIEDIACQINLSPWYFQKGFSIICGLTVSEYIKNRRLSLAGRDLQMSGSKVIDIAMKYGYDSPDSFTKAFTRFHGVTPIAAKNGQVTLKNFMPYRIQFTMKGGFEMNCKIVKKPSFTVIGCSKLIPYNEGYKECPKFWSEHYNKGNGQYICGMYGICVDENTPEGTFMYMIADDYVPSKNLLEGFETIVIPQNTWAVFPCIGAMPKALQSVTSKIFSEWLPENSDYEIAEGYNIEFYTPKQDYPQGNADENYYCEIWIPVKAK